ncbi:RNA polymerase sigma factor [Aporhodopirellula aestuarii]|uniref:Sigma-70 family RNA polymerase sigma factor n=1 Tax=Aporhodopirellula aestuarii TaxID=2950107 RepID=A0ABT0TZ74_9BACT|nr:sigma-70 family RNA polymerase sigma factor [Aporhodopirellula aestuarii]MCM2369907.1 sigma-70 family RNA polymerase sigma factor [Aporhodopirellula aestuarii]
MNHEPDICLTGQEVTEFASTCWSLVLNASAASDDTAVALQRLCETYWYPLYAYARRSGRNQHDAMDLTQGFFTQLLENRGLASVQPEKGRFRSFLLASLKNYIRNDYRDRKTQKRGGHVLVCSMGEYDLEGTYQSRIASQDTAETIFEREWAESMLNRVLEQMREDYTNAGRKELFDALHSYLVANEERLPQARIAAQLGLSVPAVKMSIRRMRNHYGKLLREEVARTLESHEDVDDELNRMIRNIQR